MSLIERTFREKIVLVGVTLPGRSDGVPPDVETERHLDELALLVVHGRRRRGGPGPPAP